MVISTLQPALLIVFALEVQTSKNSMENLESHIQQIFHDMIK